MTVLVLSGPDDAAAIAFAKDIDGPIVCKTLSSIAVEEAGQIRITYTTAVEVSNIDPDQLAVTAHLLQERIGPKKFDARVVLVGDHVFAFAVHSTSEQGRLDWRSDYDALSYLLIDAPTDVVGVCADIWIISGWRSACSTSG